MIVQKTEITFEEYCLNHTAHPHCAGCGLCICDPRCAEIRPIWCVGCYERIDKSVGQGIPRPWDGDGMVLFDYDDRFSKGNWAEAFERITRFGIGKIVIYSQR